MQLGSRISYRFVEGTSRASHYILLHKIQEIHHNLGYANISVKRQHFSYSPAEVSVKSHILLIVSKENNAMQIMNIRF